MAEIIIFCTACWVSRPLGDRFPAVCPACFVDTRWSIHPPAALTPDGYRETRDDGRFLRGLRIRPEDPAVE